MLLDESQERLQWKGAEHNREISEEIFSSRKQKFQLFVKDKPEAALLYGYLGQFQEAKRCSNTGLGVQKYECLLQHRHECFTFLYEPFAAKQKRAWHLFRCTTALQAAQQMEPGEVVVVVVPVSHLQLIW